MKKILLVEPAYKTKFAPLGLMRISSYHKSEGDVVSFIKGEQKLDFTPDKIYITSLFTYRYKETLKSVRFYKKQFPKAEIIIGGVLATLMPDLFRKEGIKVHIGLLKEVETYPPDYDLIEDIDYSLTFTSRGCKNKCGFCVPQSANVLLEQGFEKIKDLDCEKNVFIDKPYKINNLQKREYNGKLYTFNFYKFRWPLKVTEDHKIPICRNGKDIEIEAKEIKIGDSAKIPILKTNKQKFNLKFLKLSGYYLSEGSCSKCKNRKDSWQTAFTFNKKETRLYKEVVSLIKDVYGIKSRLSDTGTAIQVVSGKKKLAKSLVSSFGKGARNKFIQQDILYCSEEELYELLKGYYYGDGSIVKSKDGKIRIKCAGVSESLMYSIFLILIKLGYNPRLDRRKTCDVIQGRKVNASKWIYCVDLSIKEEVAKFAKEVYDIKFNLKKKYSKDEKKKFVEECGKSGNITAFCKKKGIIFQNYYAWKKNKRIKEEFVRKKGFILVPITEISINNYNSPVYNIEVNDVHKYICNGILINNCVVPKIEGNIYSRDWIKDINLKFKKIIFMDNNWLAKDKKDWLKDIKLLKELKKKGIREVDFNQSLDCREITEWHFKQMKGIPITPIRFSFDHMGQDKFAQKAIELSHKYGFRKITFDVLYNWNDTVDDFYYRLREINKRIATAVPMRYCPIDRTDKEYVGKNWTKKERDAINKINPYQKGQLSAKGNMDEFDYFYGKDVKEFKRLLNFKNINKLTNLKMKRFSRRKIK